MIEASVSTGHKSVASPSEILRGAYQSELSLTYQWLRERSGISPAVLNVGLQAVAEKRSRLGGFLLGEIFPSALCHHFPIPAERRSRLFAAWLSMYSFIELADRSIDTNTPLGHQEMLAANNLLAFGVAEMCSYCTTDTQRELLLRNINAAFQGELNDHAAQIDADGRNRSASDTDKNRALIVATIGFCLAANKDPAAYVAFVEQLLPVFQFLDDLQDIGEDLEQGNITDVVKTYLSKHDGDARNAISDRHMYLKLAHCPQFGEMLRTAIQVLEHSLLLLDFSEDVILVQYFSSLMQHLRSLQLLCDEVTSGSRVAEPEEVAQKVFHVAAST